MTATSPAPQPWQRQNGESSEAWHAFELYRDHDAGAGRRSLAKVGQQSGKNLALIERWSARWGWVARVQAWEAQQDREWTQEVLRQRRIVARRHADTARLMIDKALARLEKLDPDTLTPRELLEFIKGGMDIESRIYGLDQAASEQHPVSITIDGRLLPPVPASAED